MLIHINGLEDEDFVNYKKASMFLSFPHCTFKCEKDCGVACCQNSDLAKIPSLNVPCEILVERYMRNSITHAIVFGGLEPFDSWEEILYLVQSLRQRTEDDIIIYTGYKEEEIQDKIDVLKEFKNIIIKMGRFVPDQPHHKDEVLGVELASPNQYARRIS